MKDPKLTAEPDMVCSECRSKHPCGCKNLHDFKTFAIIGGLLVLYILILTQCIISMRAS